MADNKNAVIAGAGVGGLTAALALHRRGIPVSVYEKHGGLQHHTTGFTLWSYAIARLAELGIGAPELEGVGNPVEVMEIRNHFRKLRIILFAVPTSTVLPALALMANFPC